MDITILYLLSGIAGVLFLISLISFMTNNSNIITVISMLISTTVTWKLGNVFLNGTLTRIIEGTTNTEVVRDSTAAGVYHWIAFVLFIAFIIQVLSVIKSSNVVEE